MRKAIDSIIDNKIFRILIITIFLATFFQVGIESYSISNKSNLNGKYIEYQLVYEENYPIISALLLKKVALFNNIHLDLPHSTATAFKTAKPACNTQLKSNQISYLYKYMRDRHAYEYCTSFKLDNSKWINYIITPKIGVERIVVFLSVITLAIILLIGVFCWILLKIVLPIKSLQSNAYELGMTLVKKDIHSNGIKVLHNVSDSLNFMQNKLFDALRIRTQMLSMITHDLKAPIARLSLRYKLGIVDDKKNLQDIEFLEQLADQIILDLKESMFEHEKLEWINIGSLLDSLSARYSNIEIVNTAAKLFIKGRKNSLLRAFDNLLSNSKKYSEHVIIKIYSNETQIIISIKDYGTGIKESELINIFRPFYQPSGSILGHGLGLTIAREIVLSHSGTIDIRNHYQPHGVIIDVTLPY
ncbi:HAMP domain-containing sensor histidine kinase [Francisellaceae bacterium CB52]|jgi:two-component system osmolarity sensor histidine kinase EnvZ